MIGKGVAIACKTVDHRATRVAEIHYLGGFVDGLACGVVDGLAQYLHVEMAVQEYYLRVPARHEEAYHRELGPLGAVAPNEMGQDMRLQVVDLDHGDAEGLGKAFGKGDADHEGAEQTGPTCKRYGIYLVLHYAGIGEGCIDHGDYVKLMSPRCEFWHNTSILLMHLLRGYDIGEYRVVPQHSCRRVVTRGFY